MACGCRIIGRLGQRVSWLLLVGRAGCGQHRESCAGRSQGESRRHGRRGDPGRRRRCDVRHRDRCLSHRVARAAPARRRLRHVAVRLAHRIRDSGSVGARDCRARSAGRSRTSPARRSRIPAMVVGLVLGEPARHRAPSHAQRRRRQSSTRSSRRWSNSSSAAARCWCCCSSCCTRSATRWRT